MFAEVVKPCDKVLIMFQISAVCSSKVRFLMKSLQCGEVCVESFHAKGGRE